MGSRSLPTLAAQRAELAAPAAQLHALASVQIGREFEQALAAASQWPLVATGIDVLQMNLGKVCNQTCRHCHVDAGPDRTEVMSRETMLQCLRAVSDTEIRAVDLTGGAPELNSIERTACIVPRHMSTGSGITAPTTGTGWIRRCLPIAR